MRTATRGLLVGGFWLMSLGVLLGQLPPAPPDAGAYPEPADVPRYMPKAVLGEKAMVSAAHPLAARAGVDVLKAGGNAIDATVAVQMALNVVEPQSSGIGGGCFIVYYDARERKAYCLDGREEVPAGARRSDFLDEQGKEQRDALTGGLPVGVPGTVAAMWLAHQRWGKLSMPQLLEPAIRLAEDGTGVTPRLAVSIAANQSRFLKFPSSRAAFLRPDGSLPEIGELRKQPDLARTFRLLAQQGPKFFYEGEIARDIVAAVQNAPYQPGHLTLDDLRSYRPLWREPVRFSYRGYEIVSMPSPSSGGITLGLTLGILETVDLKAMRRGTIEELDALARAGATAFADRNAYLGDQDWWPALAMRDLLRPERVKERAKAAWAFTPGRPAAPGPRPGATGAHESPALPVGDGAFAEGENTTHFSVVDAEGNVVSCTTTIEHGMGSGLVVPGRGFLLNNELTDFDLGRAEGPNALDTSRRPRPTAVPPEERPGGKRPRSSMTPVIVFKDGKPYLTVGSPGGSQIIGVVAQVLVNVLDYGLDMQSAVNAPRLSSRNGPLALEVLYPKRKSLEDALRSRGWQVRKLTPWYEVWGGVHGIRIRDDGKLEGGADPRREGAVRGY
jgi:gamma-glutamyltranspeptidase/glutathione hydrolase